MEEYEFQDGDAIFGIRLTPEDFLRLFSDLLNLYHAADKDKDTLSIVVIGRKKNSNSSIGENVCDAYTGVGILDLIINHRDSVTSISELFPPKNQGEEVYVQKVDDMMFFLLDSMLEEHEDN